MIFKIANNTKSLHIFSDYLTLLLSRYVAPAIFSEGEAEFLPEGHPL